VRIRDAATVILLRDGADGLEAWLLTRVVAMAFAGGMTVFPGGRVDEADATLPVTDAEVARVAARFDCAPEFARSLVGAAARETFEETGVLLTVPSADLSGARADVERGFVSFGDLLRANGLTIDAAALHPWSRWVTPEGESPRRYDARFFVAELPADQRAQDVTTESTEASWVPVTTALERAHRGELKLMPPTLTTLSTLADHASVADVIAAAEQQPLDPIQPTLRMNDDGSATIELPDGRLIPIPRSMFDTPSDRSAQNTPRSAGDPGPKR
jgi:8-oxo-dGTP pyrophosphatase MutT (NUDIX family)